MNDKRPHPRPIPLYAVAIQEAIASGNIEQMKQAAEMADHTLANIDEIRGALTEIKRAIAKLEG